MVFYHVALSKVALIIALGYLLFGGVTWFCFEPAKKFFLHFHRNTWVGIGLFLIVTGWTLWLTYEIDLMEYTAYRQTLLVILFALAFFVLFHAREYLSVRALAVLLLLGANVMLDSAFLDDRAVKYPFVLLAYIHITLAMVIAGMPYLFRDSMKFLYAQPKRMRALLSASCFLGVVLLALSLWVF